MRPFTLAAAFLLALAPPPRPAQATCPCGGELEIVFVIDCTSSMKHLIGTVKAQAAKIVHVLAANLAGVRVGLVAYRTERERKFLDAHSRALTGDHAAVLSAIEELRAVGGGSEDVAAAIEKAVTGMDWTAGSRKVVVLIGDEGPDPRRERELYALARQAQRAGIVIYTITISESAYYYYKNLHPEKVAEMERRLGQAAVHAGFRHPTFVKTAELTRGRAVGSRNVRDLVKWVLAFGLDQARGEEYDARTVQDIIDWRGPPPREPEDEPKNGAAKEAPRGRALIGRLRHDGGWDVPHNDAALLDALGKSVVLSGPPRMQVLGLEDKDLSAYGLLYLSGVRAPRWTAREKARLARYVDSGGTLFVDPGCEDQGFGKGIKTLLAELFGKGALRRLPAEHEVFSTAHQIDSVRLALLQPGVRASGRKVRYREARPELHGIRRDGRLAVILSPFNLGCGWQTVPFGKPCHLHDEDALKLTQNVILYSLQ